MVTHKQQDALLVGPKTTLWILALCVVICSIAGILGQHTHEANMAQEVDQVSPNVLGNGQMRAYGSQGPRGQMYELREQTGVGNTSPGGNASGAAPVSK